MRPPKKSKSSEDRAQPGGLATTLDLLARTKNEAAVEALLPALDSAHRAVQEGALKALLKRRPGAGQHDLLRRWHELSDRWQSIAAEHPGRMTGAIRDAVVGADPKMCGNGCDAMLRLREYDLAPMLINAAGNESGAIADLAAKTLLELTQLLYEELAHSRDYRNRRDPQLIRSHVVTSLETSVRRFDKHRRTEIVEAFLLLARRDNAVLKRILQSPF